MRLTFRRATDKDWQAVASLEESVSGSKFYSSITDEAGVKGYLRQSCVFLIQSDGKTIGTVSYEMKSKSHACLDGLIVHPDSRKHGIATKAIEFLLSELKGVKRIDLPVHPENSTALSLYLKFGFKIEGRKDNFYGDGEPRLVLALKTKQPAQ